MREIDLIEPPKGEHKPESWDEGESQEVTLTSRDRGGDVLPFGTLTSRDRGKQLISESELVSMGDQLPFGGKQLISESELVSMGDQLPFGGNEPTKASEPTKAGSAYVPSKSGGYPEHLLQAELSGKTDVGLRLHGAGNHTIGYGLDLKYDSNNYGFLKKAGVSDDMLKRLKDGDTTARITIQQAEDASNQAYHVKLKQVSSLVRRKLGVKLEDRSDRMQDMLVSLAYNGYLTNVKRKNQDSLNSFRGKIWELAKANDEDGLLKFIDDSEFRGGAVRRRFERSKFL